MRTDPNEEYPVQFGDGELLNYLVIEHGYASSSAMVNAMAFDSVVPGACRHCGELTDRLEPDQEEGWCWCCESNQVASVLVLGGVM